MYNLLISIAGGVVAFLLFWATGLVNWWGALLPATVAFAGLYFFLARRTLRQLEVTVVQAQQMLTSQPQTALKRIDPAIAKMKEALALGKWQFFIEPQVHAQVGMLLYMAQRFEEAKPHLAKAFGRIGQARAMYGALLFREKNFAEMEKVFENAVATNKNDGFLWSIYAWCLDASEQTDKALKVLARAVSTNPNDERVKQNQLALQNERRMKMKAYGNEWWAFHLEKPPPSLTGGQPTQGFQIRKGYRQPPQRRH